MKPNINPITILLADDSEIDRRLTREALIESKVLNDLYEVEDGEQLMEYLNRYGEYSDPLKSPRPGLILLDLNMPRKNGKEVLEEIKADENLRRIPIVILTTSSDEEDIISSYDYGVSSYITKPVTFLELVRVMRGFGEYWLNIVTVPNLDHS